MSNNICDGYSPGVSFWDLYPIYRNIPLFDKLWKYDRTQGKTKSSKIMWGISFAYHPKSEMYNLSDKFERIEKSIIDVKDFNWEDYQEHIDQFLDMVLTQAEKSRVNWDRRMKQRDEFLEGVEYNLETLAELDKANIATGKMYDEYMRITKLLAQEEAGKKKSRPVSDTANGKL